MIRCFVFFFGLAAGLYHDDRMKDEVPVVAEALRRLPESMYVARMHRSHRAIQLSRNKALLPKEMWTTYDDVSNFLWDSR